MSEQDGREQFGDMMAAIDPTGRDAAKQPDPTDHAAGSSEPKKAKPAHEGDEEKR